jgi:hypothetical protein
MTMRRQHDLTPKSVLGARLGFSAIEPRPFPAPAKKINIKPYLDKFGALA